MVNLFRFSPIPENQNLVPQAAMRGTALLWNLGWGDVSLIGVYTPDEKNRILDHSDRAHLCPKDETRGHFLKVGDEFLEQLKNIVQVPLRPEETYVTRQQEVEPLVLRNYFLMDRDGNVEDSSCKTAFRVVKATEGELMSRIGKDPERIDACHIAAIAENIASNEKCKSRI